MGSPFSFRQMMQTVSKFISEEPAMQRKLNSQQKAHQQEIENAVLVLAAAVLRCDRAFSDSTEQYLHDFMTKQFGERGRKARVNAVTNHITTGTEPFTKIACKELGLLTTYDSRLRVVQFLFGLAAADDFVNAKETRCIQRIAGYLGVAAADFAALQADFLNLNNPYAVLGVAEGVSFAEVKAAYRRMVLKFHPDRKASHADEEVANTQFRAIKNAFERIEAEMGE